MTMRGIWVLLAVGGWCVSCAGAGAPLPQTVSALPVEMPPPVESVESIPEFLYACPDGFQFSARIEPRLGGKAWLLLPDRTLELQPDVVASGAKYAAEGVIFWAWGEEARLELDGVEHHDCLMQNS